MWLCKIRLVTLIRFGDTSHEELEMCLGLLFDTAKVILSCYKCERKCNEMNEIVRHNAHLMAQGFSQMLCYWL